MTRAQLHPVRAVPRPDLSRRRALAAGLALGALGSGTARAQSEFPSRPVRLVVPFPAGGAADLGARAAAVQLAAAFGKPVNVDNRAGADGAVAALEVVKSPPDGHTLYFGTATSMSYTPNIKKTPPYDPIADFTPISNVCVFTFYLAVAPSVPVTTLAEFVAWVKANPGKLAYASGNATGILAAAQLAASNRLDMTHVPYKGEAQAAIDLIGGRVQAMFATPAILPQLLKEKFRLLAVLLPQRTRAFPDVPTMIEAGQPLVDISPWGGLFGPARVPRDVVDRISRDFNVVMRRADVVEQFDKLGMLPLPSTPDELTKVVKSQLDVFSRAIRDSGMQQE
jgi:tripartite-type tricarboxylate transporter receptor subunit TctC